MERNNQYFKQTHLLHNNIDRGLETAKAFSDDIYRCRAKAPSKDLGAVDEFSLTEDDRQALCNAIATY